MESANGQIYQIVCCDENLAEKSMIKPSEYSELKARVGEILTGERAASLPFSPLTPAVLNVIR